MAVYITISIFFGLVQIWIIFQFKKSGKYRRVYDQVKISRNVSVFLLLASFITGCLLAYYSRSDLSMIEQVGLTLLATVTLPVFVNGFVIFRLLILGRIH